MLYNQYMTWNMDNIKLNLTSRFHKIVSQQDTQRTYYVTPRRVRATVAVVEKQWVFYNLSVRICGLRYPACNAHSTYHLGPAPLYKIFKHYLINDTIFEKKKKVLITKRVFWFSLQLLSETFLILRIIERVMIKDMYRSSCKVPVILVRF